MLSKSLHLPIQILKVYIEAFPGLSPDGLSDTLPSHGCILENGSNWNNAKNVHSKDRDPGEEPPIAQAKLTGQSAVTSSL